jgi:hypothetical protein
MLKEQDTNLSFINTEIHSDPNSEDSNLFTLLEMQIALNDGPSQ